MKQIKEKSILGSDQFRLLEGARDARPHEGVMSNIFLGEMKFNLVSPFPTHGGPKREKFLSWVNSFQQFLWDKVNPEAIEESGEIPDEVISDLKKMGAFGLIVPEEYGGLGFSYEEYFFVFVLAGSWCINLTVLLSAANSIGIIAPIKYRGTEEQKKKYLPLCAGGVITGLGLTEADSGSDPSRKKLLATRVRNDGGELSGYLLNGETLWTTNAVKGDGVPLADYIAVAAKIHKNDADAEAGKDPHFITLITVNMKNPGISTPIRCRFGSTKALYNGVIRFENVFVPLEDRIGDELKGFKYVFESLVFGRFSLVAACVGTLKQLLQISRWWGKERIQGGNPIGCYELKAEDLVGMASDVFVNQGLVKYLCSLADDHKDIRIESAAAKVIVTRTLWNTVQNAGRMRGGRSYETAASQRRRGEPGIGLIRIMVSAWVETIFEGENDVMTLYESRECMDPYIRVLLAVLAKMSSPEKTETDAQEKTAFSWKEVCEFIKHFLHLGNASKDEPVDSYAAFMKDKSYESYQSFLERETKNIQRTLWVTVLAHRSQTTKKQIVSEALVHKAENLFLMAIALSYAELNKDKPLAIELAHHFCDMKIEDMTGARARTDDEWIKHGSHNRVVELSKRIMEGEAVWLEEGIISLLEKEGVKV